MEALRGGAAPLPIVDVGCGTEFTVALDSSGQLWSWGCNYYGKLGLGKGEGRDDGDGRGVMVPQLVEGLPPSCTINALCCGTNHVIAMKVSAPMAKVAS